MLRIIKKWFEIDNVKDYKIFLNQTNLNLKIYNN